MLVICFALFGFVDFLYTPTFAGSKLVEARSLPSHKPLQFNAGNPGSVSYSDVAECFFIAKVLQSFALQ
jgi:hypothetical protein